MFVYRQNESWTLATGHWTLEDDTPFPSPLPPLPLSAICLPLWDLCDLSLAIYFLDLAIFCASKHEIELAIFEQRPGKEEEGFSGDLWPIKCCSY